MDKQNIKISIIVPVYNVEKYINESLDSILTQDYKNFELLLIDDGSTDASPAICDEYVAKDSRVKVIHQKNGGVSNARNTALENVDGDYITFIDPDDSVNQGYFSKVVETITMSGNPVDVIYIPYPVFSEKKNVEYYNTKAEIEKEVLPMFFRKSNLKSITMATVWSLFIRIDVIRNIRFNPQLVAIGDKPFVLDTILNAESLALLPVNYYNYRLNPSSITNKYLVNRAMHITHSNEEIARVLDKHKITSGELIDGHNNCVLSEYYWVIRNEARKSDLELNNRQIKQYYEANHIGKLLTWSKALKVGLRNPKWFLIKMGKVDKVLTLFWKRNHDKNKT